MKRFFIAMTVMALAALTFSAQPLWAPPSTTVVINEVQYDAPQSGTVDSSFEWIELYNMSAGSIPLNGWVIKDNYGTDVITTGESIPAGGYVVLVADEDSFAVNYDTTGMTMVEVGKLGNGLANSNDMLILEDDEEIVIDWMNWGTPSSNWDNYFADLWDPGVPDAPAGFSLGRLPNGADTDSVEDFTSFPSPSPGEPNGGPTEYDTVSIFAIQRSTVPSGDSPLKDSLVTTGGVVSEEDFIDGGFIIADKDSQWHALHIYYTGTDTIRRGDSVRVFGQVQEYYHRTEIAPDSVIVTVDSGGMPMPVPLVVQIDDVSGADSASAESYETVLIQLNNVVVADDSVGYGEWTVMSLDSLDTCQVDNRGDPPKYLYEPQVGDTLSYLRGIVNYSYDKYKVSPRDDNDIGIPLPPEITLVYRVLYVPLAADSFTWVCKAYDPDGALDTLATTLHFTVRRGSSYQDTVLDTTVAMDYEGVAPNDSFVVDIDGGSIGLTDEDLVEGIITVVDTEGYSADSYVNGFFVGTTRIDGSGFRENDENCDNVYWGYGVRVRGVATVGTGVFREQGEGVDIYLQDQTGGVNIFSFDDSSEVAQGDSLVVQGQISQFFGKLEVESVNKVEPFIINLGPGDEPSPIVLTCAQIETMGDDTIEEYEGMLVKVLQVYRDTTGPDWPALGDNANLLIYDVSDTTTMRIDKETNIDEQPEPCWPQNIVGILGQYDDNGDSVSYCEGYQLIPRDTSDFSPGWPPQFIRGDAEADGDHDIFDGLKIIYWLGGVPPDPLCINACDTDDDEDVDIFDGLQIIYWLGGVPTPPEPPCCVPPGDCCYDPTPGGLTCLSFPPCGWNPKEVAGASFVGRADASKLTVVSGESDVTVTVTNAEDLVGFNFVVEYDAEQATAKFVDNTGLVTEGFDVFAGGTDEPGVVKVVGIRDIDLADGESKLPAGEHRVARIVFEGKVPASLKVTNSVMAAEYNRALNHHVVAKGEAVPPRPTAFQLDQNYPNPFNPETEITYALPKDCRVTLEVYNVLGQRVRTLVNGDETAGFKSVIWDSRNDRGDEVTGGVYFYRISAGDFNAIRKMVLLK